MSTWANADVAPTVTAAISAKATNVKNFGVVGMCVSPIANRIRKQENRKVCAALRSIKLGSAPQNVVACVHQYAGCRSILDLARARANPIYIDVY
jgi:hypothetical protein